MRVRVKSGRMGYYGLMRRREGTEFVLEAPADFSEKWMEVVETPPSVKPVEKAKVVERAKPVEKAKDKDGDQ